MLDPSRHCQANVRSAVRLLLHSVTGRQSWPLGGWLAGHTLMPPCIYTVAYVRWIQRASQTLESRMS